MAAESTGSLEIHRLTLSSDNLPEMLPIVLALSNGIFSAAAESKYASLAVWRERLSSPSSSIIYVSPSLHPEQPVGFLFAHPRSHSPSLSRGESESLHIWLAGVLPERRKEGCLSKMISALEPGRVLTVCTTPAKYPDMWQWLLNRGWSVERELEEGKVLLCKRS